MAEDKIDADPVLMTEPSASSSEASTPKQTLFSRIPKKVQGSKVWDKIFVDAHLESDANPGEKYDIPKIDRDILSRYYAIKAKPMLGTKLPDEVKNDPIFTYEKKHFGEEEALKAYLYRQDLREEDIKPPQKKLN